ncbi:MAG: hypothetical protein GY702_15255 [Desulfobulbaceae bacterium]|nr:hypothetical protein [Desulfobulbaceae bacterium]
MEMPEKYSITIKNQITMVEFVESAGLEDLCEAIDESVDLIAFLFNIEANKKFYHRHIVDIPRIKFLV